ncbi:MAG: hypothetical protein ACP5MD_06150 [Verrucomicrobiia bacterium]
MKTAPAFFALGCLVGCTGFFPVRAGDYAGMFKSRDLTVNLARTRDGYSGTIQVGGTWQKLDRKEQ